MSSIHGTPHHPPVVSATAQSNVGVRSAATHPAPTERDRRVDAELGNDLRGEAFLRHIAAMQEASRGLTGRQKVSAAAIGGSLGVATAATAGVGAAVGLVALAIGAAVVGVAGLNIAGTVGLAMPPRRAAQPPSLRKYAFSKLGIVSPADSAALVTQLKHAHSALTLGRERYLLRDPASIAYATLHRANGTPLTPNQQEAVRCVLTYVGLAQVNGRTAYRANVARYEALRAIGWFRRSTEQAAELARLGHVIAATEHMLAYMEGTYPPLLDFRG